MVSLFLFSKPVRGKYHPMRKWVSGSFMSWSSLSSLPGGRVLKTVLFLLCYVVLFCLFHLIFCRSRSYALWGTSLCILFCGKEYVRDSGSGPVFYVIVQMVFYNSAKGSMPFFFKCMNIGVLLQFMFSNLVHIPIFFFFAEEKAIIFRFGFITG